VAVSVLGICGSLRRASFNRAALAAAVELAPEGVRLEVADLAGIPPYDEDVFAKGFPAPVAELRGRIKAADALLIATPEYNFSISGVLKNAIDWVSRPPDQPFAGKPLAIMGASAGRSGTMRAQYHLRQIAVFLDLKPVNKPEVMIDFAGKKFDAELRLTDEQARGQIRDLLQALASWTRLIQAV
jgi:chromate reductase, NAD(P)H dehydrogenase (quinone)